MKNTLASSGRRVRIYKKLPRLNLEIQNKAKPPFDLWQYSTPIRLLRCSRTRTHPRLAKPSASDVTFWNADQRVSSLSQIISLYTNYPHRKILRTTPSPFHYNISQSEQKPQRESSWRKFLEKSVPLSNNFWTCSCGTAHYVKYAVFVLYILNFAFYDLFHILSLWWNFGCMECIEYAHIFRYAHVCVCMYVCMYVHICIYVCVCVVMYVCVCMYVCMCVCV